MLHFEGQRRPRAFSFNIQSLDLYTGLQGREHSQHSETKDLAAPPDVANTLRTSQGVEKTLEGTVRGEK